MIFVETPERWDGYRVVSFDYALREEWTLKRLENAYVCVVLHSVGGHRERAARILGIDGETLDRKIRELASAADGRSRKGTGLVR